AGRLSRAIDGLRDAPNEHKSPRLSALKSEACTAADLCKLKDTCVEAYTVQLRGLESTRVAGRALERDAGSASDGQLPKLLLAAERDLASAKELSARCAD